MVRRSLTVTSYVCYAVRLDIAFGIRITDSTKGGNRKDSILSYTNIEFTDSTDGGKKEIAISSRSKRISSQYLSNLNQHQK